MWIRLDACHCHCYDFDRRPIRLVAQDAALSRLKHGFEPRMGHISVQSPRLHRFRFPFNPLQIGMQTYLHIFHSTSVRVPDHTYSLQCSDCHVVDVSNAHRVVGAAPGQ